MNSEAPRHPDLDAAISVHPSAGSPAVTPPSSLLRAVGSLWFAAVLLVMLLVAMACATVFESAHSPEQALGTFYRAWWFKLLLSLLAVNSLVAIVLRYPFSGRHIGFLLTHASILLILAGALVSEGLGVNGRISIVEGQATDHFANPDQEVIIVANPRDRTQTEFDLDGRIFGGFTAVDKRPPVSLGERFLGIFGESAAAGKALAGFHVKGNSTIEIVRYIPDSDLVERIADDSARPNCALEVTLSTNDQMMSAWVVQNESASLGPLTVGFRMIGDAAELARLIEEHPTAQPASAGIVKIEYNGTTYQIPLDSCMNKSAPVDDTGYSVRVLRYLPHATVGHDGQITNASDRAVNPFIEAELTGPGGTEKRMAFARFPEFSSMHNAMQKGASASQPSSENLKLTFVTAEALGPNTPIEILGGPDGKLYVRFAREDGSWTTHELRVGEAVETPWHGGKFMLLQRYDHARQVRSASPVEPVRANRTPAILVKMGGGEKGTEAWLRKDEAQTVEEGGQRWSLTYTDQEVPLGYKLTLNRFHVGHYPGEMAPRSFESHITISEPLAGREENRTISMNQPVAFGGFSLFQSSYQQGEGGATSVLSVARDPGQPIVFVGYITMLIGMIVVLITRMRDRRRIAAARAAAAGRMQP
ncbi:MAG TPA: cytochrome c biogenesis protein ResB [Phycisphaerae bacterium]|nr:cytochrome c biogenesis protein ResB [Phycisphaerae bacterium]